MNFYGDLKASDLKKKEAPGNDQTNTLDAISKHGRLWYIIYEHDTIKDKDKGNEMAIARMKLLNPSSSSLNSTKYLQTQEFPRIGQPPNPNWKITVMQFVLQLQPLRQAITTHTTVAQLSTPFFPLGVRKTTTSILSTHITTTTINQT